MLHYSKVPFLNCPSVKELKTSQVGSHAGQCSSIKEKLNQSIWFSLREYKIFTELCMVGTFGSGLLKTFASIHFEKILFENWRF